MGYQELNPKELLYAGLAAQHINDEAWCTRWEVAGSPAEREELFTAMLPPELEFWTSGSTGPSRCWLRDRDAAWSEASMLAGFVSSVRPEPPDAVVAFAPPRHVYGALGTAFMPAWLGVPVWYRQRFEGAMPKVEGQHVVVIATPWIFALLLRHMDWVRSFRHVTVLYSSAMLPADAYTFLERAGEDRAALVELLGSTETGGIAHRQWSGGEPPPWTLFPDVTFVTPDAGGAGGSCETGEIGGKFAVGAQDESGSAVPLVIHGPRLAQAPGESRPEEWSTGDLVELVDDRSFRLVGRVGRLVKVNGRRINLDEAEHLVRARVDCADLALVAVEDRMTGEQIDLYVVPREGADAARPDLSAVPEALGVRPQRVHVVAGINRSRTGKLRHQPTEDS